MTEKYYVSIPFNPHYEDLKEIREELNKISEMIEVSEGKAGRMRFFAAGGFQRYATEEFPSYKSNFTPKQEETEEQLSVWKDKLKTTKIILEEIIVDIEEELDKEISKMLADGSLRKEWIERKKAELFGIYNLSKS